MVQDLINQIVEKTGIPADKAQDVLGVVANYVKQQFPMMGGQVDSLLGTSGSPATNQSKEPDSGFMSDIGGRMGF